jgi:hypothetical protein
VDLQTDLRVQSGGRLIQEEQLRIVHQRQRESQALLLSAGKLRIVGIVLIPELQAFE